MMLAVSIALGLTVVLNFLLIGGVIGYLTYGYLASQASALPQHPEFYDDEGNVIPDEILAIRFENSYEQYEEWDDEE